MQTDSFAGMFDQNADQWAREEPMILSDFTARPLVLWTVRFSKVPRVIHCKYCFASTRSRHWSRPTRAGHQCPATGVANRSTDTCSSLAV